MPHIHTEPGQHDHTVSAFIVRMDTPEPSIMLHVHKKVGLLLQFGGHIELNENPWEAMSHELTEETGYDPDQLSILQPRYPHITFLPNAVVHPVPLVQNTHNYEAGNENHKHVDTVYAFVATSAPRQKPDEGESTDIRVFILSELEVIPEGIIAENCRAVSIAILEYFLENWERKPLTDFS